MFGIQKSSPEYKALTEGPEDDGFHAPCAHCKRGSDGAAAGNIWIILTIILAFISTSLVVKLAKVRNAGLGTATDFAAATHFIKPQAVKFTGTAGFDENGTAYRVVEPDSVQYVGNPSPKLDGAWEGMIAGRYFIITEEEAEKAWGVEYKDYHEYPGGGYMAGLDVLHTLHCVNMLRKSVDPEYYFPDGISVSFRRYHLDHCLDIVRQALQCHGDLTPVPVRWFESINDTFTDSDQVHSCRDFSKIRNWATQRYNGSLAVRKIEYNGEF